MITTKILQELQVRHGLHRKATICDLPAKVLAEHLTVDALSVLCGRYFSGNQFDALKMKDLKIFQRINHQQWDLNISSMGGQRLCGKPANGECPHPFEDNIEWWLNVRPKLKIKQ